LADQASFTKKLTRTQQGQHCFLALSRHDSDLHLARLNKINRVRLVSLRKDGRVFLELQYMFAHHNAFEQALDMRIDFCEVELCDLFCLLHRLGGGESLPVGHRPECISTLLKTHSTIDFVLG
jgi:hypothetical protein